MLSTAIVSSEIIGEQREGHRSEQDVHEAIVNQWPGFLFGVGQEPENADISLPVHVRRSTYGSPPTSGSESPVYELYGFVFVVHCLP